MFSKKFLIGVDINGKEHKVYYSTYQYYKIIINNILRKESYPSKEFSIETNIPNTVKQSHFVGIHTDWDIRFNHNWYWLFFYLNINTDWIVNIFYNKLIKYNPSLKQIDTCDNIYYKHDIVYGAVSKFNIEDIKYYNSINKKETKDKSLEYMKLIFEKFNLYPEWGISYNTFQHIMNYLPIKNRVYVKSTY